MGGVAAEEDHVASWTTASPEEVSGMDDGDESPETVGHVHRMLRKNKLFMRCVRDVFELMSTPEGFMHRRRIRGGDCTPSEGEGEGELPSRGVQASADHGEAQEQTDMLRAGDNHRTEATEDCEGSENAADCADSTSTATELEGHAHEAHSSSKPHLSKKQRQREARKARARHARGENDGPAAAAAAATGATSAPTLVDHPRETESASSPHVGDQNGMDFIKNIIHKDARVRGEETSCGEHHYHEDRARDSDLNTNQELSNRSLLSTYVMGSMLLLHRKLKDAMPTYVLPESDVPMHALAHSDSQMGECESP